MTRPTKKPVDSTVEKPAPKKKPTTPKSQLLHWPHATGDQGEIRLFYGVPAVADAKGRFLVEADAATVEREVNRSNPRRFVIFEG